jgi:nitrous oxidase accessory protein
MGIHSRTLLTVFLFLNSNLPSQLHAAFIKVDPSDFNAEKTIKSAIKKANTGDTVWVSGGFYHEGNIIIDKAIFLFSDENAVLDGDHKYEIISVKSNGIKISGFCMQNTGEH